MAVGTAAFIGIPGTLIRVFSQDADVLAIGYGRTSLALSLLRQIVCLLPLFWLLAQLGLDYNTWYAFPLTELISGGAGLALYHRAITAWPSQ